MKLDYLSVLVPYRPDGGWRDEAWETIRPRWEALGVDLVVESPGPGASPADFNHPAAINRARRRASGEVLLIADADTGWDDGWVERAAEMIRMGDFPWALPSEYWQLSAAQTRALQVYGAAPPLYDSARAEWVGYGVSWSGLVVVPAEAFDLVGGYDERWTHWGSDDGAFGLAMETLVGHHVRVAGRALHHWHPRPDEMHERQGEQHALMRRYADAAGDPDAMRRVRFGS